MLAEASRRHRACCASKWTDRGDIQQGGCGGEQLERDGSYSGAVLTGFSGNGRHDSVGCVAARSAGITDEEHMAGSVWLIARTSNKRVWPIADS